MSETVKMKKLSCGVYAEIRKSFGTSYTVYVDGQNRGTYNSLDAALSAYNKLY